MSLNCTAKTYSGQYGASDNVGDIIHLAMFCSSGDDNNNDNNNNLDNGDLDSNNDLGNNKEIVLIIDISGSMEESMANVKSSLLAFRDCLVGKTAKEMENMEDSDRDVLFRESVNLKLLAFSNEVYDLWDNNSDKYFEDVVIELESKSMTNMGDALVKGFEKCSHDKFTWIIVMTDGESNEGPCRTANSFQRMVARNKPINSKVVSLGYGDRFDPEVLNVIGTFVYVKNKEMIPVVLGNLAHEINNSSVFNVIIDMDNDSTEEINDNTLIIPSGVVVEKGKIIVGSRLMGPFSPRKDYHFVYLPHGNLVSSDNLRNYKTINVRYTSILDMKEYETTVNIECTGISPSLFHRQLFYEAEKKRLIQKLYNILQESKHITHRRELRKIRKIIKKWDDESEPHKEEILYMVSMAERSKGKYNARNNSHLLNSAVGSGYAALSGDFEVTESLLNAKHYMASPLINNGK